MARERRNGGKLKLVREDVALPEGVLGGSEGKVMTLDGIAKARIQAGFIRVDSGHASSQRDFLGKHYC